MATRKTEPRHEVDRDAGQEAREARLDDVVENPLDPTGGADGDGPDPWDQQLDDGPGFGHQDHPFGEQEGVEHDGASPVIEGDNPYTDPGVDLPGPDPMDLTEDDIRPEVEIAPWLDAISPPGGLADPGGFGLPENDLDGANQATGENAGHGFMYKPDGQLAQIQPGDVLTNSVTKGGIIQTPQGDDEVTNEATGTETVTVPGEETAGGGEASGGEAGVPNVENDSFAEKWFQTTDQAEVERQAYKAARNAKIVADTKKEMEAKDKPADKPADGNDSGSQPIDPEVDPETAAAMRQYGEAKSHYMQIKLDAEVSGDVNPDPGGTETGTVAGYDPKDYLEGDEPFQGAGGQEVPIDGAIDYGPDDTDHDPDSGLDDPLPGQGGPLGPNTGWTPPEQDEWTAEEEVAEMELAPYDDGTEPKPEPSFEPDAVGPEPVAADVVDTGVDDLGI